MNTSIENYIEFIKSPKAKNLFEKINCREYLNADINKIKEALQIKYINKPNTHQNNIAYFLNTISIGMMPGSQYSKPPDVLKPDIIDFFKVLIKLECDYEKNSIGDFIKKFQTNTPDENYIEFIKSPKAYNLFHKINSLKFLNADINKIKESLHIEHIDTPRTHQNDIAYSLNTYSIGMIPESQYSSIPEDLKLDMIDFFKVIIELDYDYEENSIGDFIKKLLVI